MGEAENPSRSVLHENRNQGTPRTGGKNRSRRWPVNSKSAFLGFRESKPYLRLPSMHWYPFAPLFEKIRRHPQHRPANTVNLLTFRLNDF